MKDEIKKEGIVSAVSSFYVRTVCIFIACPAYADGRESKITAI